MREKRIFFTLAIAILLGAMLFASFGVREAKAPTGTTVYVDTTLYRTTNLVNPIIVAAKTSIGATQWLYIKVARAPHESTTEPSAATDKTFAWGFTFSWDPTMWKINILLSDVLEEPVTVTTVAQFLKRRTYTYTGTGADEFGTTIWEVSTPYATSGIQGRDSYDPVAGTIKLGDTLLGFDPTTTPLPVEYINPTIGPTAPDMGRHAGSYYDLPYTENATQAKLQLDGITTVTDPSYPLLAMIRLTATAVPPADYKGSAFHLSDVLLFDYDATTVYPATTFDAYYVYMPVVPEFPLGLASIMILAPLIPIVYLWRTRQKRKVT